MRNLCCLKISSSYCSLLLPFKIFIVFKFITNRPPIDELLSNGIPLYLYSYFFRIKPCQSLHALHSRSWQTHSHSALSCSLLMCLASLVLSCLRLPADRQLTTVTGLYFTFYRLSNPSYIAIIGDKTAPIMVPTTAASIMIINGSKAAIKDAVAISTSSS